MLADKVYRAVDAKFDPTWDAIERFEENHPILVWPLIIGLIGVFPAWCIFATTLRELRK